MSYSRLKPPRLRPGQVYADEPSELFRPSLPAWPLGYVDDGTSATRGVGAVASRDLRHRQAGVRTKNGQVVLVAEPKVKKPLLPPRRPPPQRIFGSAIRGAALSYGSKIVPSPSPGMVVKPDLRPSGYKRRPAVLVPNYPPLLAPPGATTPTVRTAPPLCQPGYVRGPDGFSCVKGPKRMSAGAAAIIAGGGGGGAVKTSPVVNGGGGPAVGPDQDEFASSSEEAIQEAEAAAQAAQDEAVVDAATAPAAKPPMSTGAKVAVGLGVGLLVLSMLGGGS
jgi:hypothetical protein